MSISSYITEQANIDIRPIGSGTLHPPLCPVRATWPLDLADIIHNAVALVRYAVPRFNSLCSSSLTA